ncbi:glycosyl transferase [Nocardiopsis terrae]|uniref:UDP:flavonoid glycosyltransferase YjiC (YdhE family) n=1 Tax=Nocardiopsis terrae TaxID=372655 RepID=A0ABR9HJT0_9ACTN|nr:glycosyltransferase [Nocardiopsis terrae]MBE1459267.1 UDP:flavonoid glycosyltransferase YjiC (YdhE family) [Nocardiopsis terrae]GHC89033.1 glycosyl transferase [Nocardiopsis terrae]
MSTVLFAPETFNLAETTRAIEVARRLRDRHECVFAGYSERYADLVEAAGFEYRPLSPVLTGEQADQAIRFDRGRGVSHPFTAGVFRARVASERELNHLLRPAATVIGSTLSQFVSARADGIPLVYVKPFAYSWPHLRQTRAVPVLGGRGRLARTVNGGAAYLLREAARYTTAKPGGWTRVARENGVRLPRRTVEALDGDLNLVASLRFRPYLLPPNYRWVGPVYAHLGEEVPAEVEALVGRAGRERRPVVYFAMGSSADREIVLGILRELSRLPVTVLAPVARYLRPGDRAGLGPHVHVFDLLPAHLLGDLIDASVIHGGEGTVQTAAASGKPFVGIGLQMEQRWNVDECVRFGNAVGLTPRQARGEPLRRAFESVLHDPDLRTRARELRRHLAGTDGARAAADHIHALIGERS